MKKGLITGLMLVVVFFWPAAAQVGGKSYSSFNKAHKSGERAEHCLRPAHDHNYSDLRIAAVEIQKVDECGFEVVNLGDNTVSADGAGHRLYYSDDFYVVRIAGEHVKRSDYRAMKRGMRGTIIYCSSAECQRVFAMQLVPDQTGFMVAGSGR